MRGGMETAEEYNARMSAPPYVVAGLDVPPDPQCCDGCGAQRMVIHRGFFLCRSCSAFLTANAAQGAY